MSGKKLTSTLEQIQADYPDATLELWCEDEHRVGLKPILCPGVCP